MQSPKGDEQQIKFKSSQKIDPNIFQSSYHDRKWLKTHGKNDYIDFTDEAILKLRSYFDSLDDDKSGSIGVNELEDPLIALGLAQTRQEVKQLIDSVDDDKSGYIEFKEFLAIMRWGKQKQGKQMNKNSEETNQKGAIYDFFKKLSEDQLGNEMDKNVPFTLNVSTYRRKKILDAIMEINNKEKKDKGQKIMQAFKKQLILIKQEQKIEKGEDPNDISIDKIPNNENGVNTRNGFPKLPKIMKPSNKLLIKPKGNAVQNKEK